MALSRGWFNRRFVVIVSLVVASQVVPASLSTIRKSGPECEQLKQWARANARSLPRTLDSFAQLDHGRRRAAFNVLSAADQASLWREQMQRFLRRPDLTIAERALADQALTVIRPETYGSRVEARAATKALTARMTATFMSDEHRKAFVDLGALARPVDSNIWKTSTAMTAGAGSLLERLAASATVEAQLCECDFGDETNAQCSFLHGNYCNAFWYGYCAFSWGCGPLWAGECNARCGDFSRA
jgi:hypothetical protein